MYYDYQWDGPSRPEWLTRELVVRGTAVIVALVLVATSFIAWQTLRSEAAGPQRPVVLFGGIHVKENGRFHIGLLEIENQDKDVTVLEVEPLMTPNVDFLGAVTSYGSRHAFQGGPGAAGTNFPPGYMRNIQPMGQVIHPDSAYMHADGTPYPVVVSAGFKLRSGIGGLNGIRVVYQVGKKKHTEFLRYAAVACHKQECKRTDRAEDTEVYRDVLRAHGLHPADAT